MKVFSQYVQPYIIKPTMIQTNRIVLSHRDKLQLQKIIGKAGDQLKTMPIGKKNGLNILPVLAAYRKNNGSYHSTLYQTILSIAHSHNPQNAQQWLHAIEALAQKPQRSQRHSTDPQQNHYKHKPNHSHAHIAIPNSTRQDMSWLTEQGKEADTSTQPAMNQNSLTHSRPFERTQIHPLKGTPLSTLEDKENFNITNLEDSQPQSTLQYINALQHYVQPPCNSPMPIYHTNGSSSSPSLVASFIQPVPDPVDPAQATAGNYHQYNLLLKGFSSLLAHHMVHQHAQKQQLKASDHRRKAMLGKSMRGLQQAAQFGKQKRSMENKADSHSRTILLKKCFDLLRFLRGLKVREEKPVDVNRLNWIGCQFILSLAVSVEEVEGESFEETSGMLLRQERVEEVCQLVRYFGHYPCTLPGPIEHTLELQRKAILQRCFSALKANKACQQNFAPIHEKRLIKLVWGVFARRWAGVRSLRVRAMARQCQQNHQTKKQVVNALAQMAYSQQVYSKRCQFITAKANQLIKAHTLQQWQEATLAKISQQDKLVRKGHAATVFFQRFTLRRAIIHICSEGQTVLEKIKTVEQTRTKQWLGRFTVVARQIRKDSKVEKEVRNMSMRLKKQTGFKRWVEAVKLGETLRRMAMTLERTILRTVGMPCFEEMIELTKIQCNLESRLMGKALKSWLAYYNNQGQERKSKQVQTVKKLRLLKIRLSFKALNHEKNLSLKKKKQVLVDKKGDEVRGKISLGRQMKWIQQLQRRYKEKLRVKQFQHQLYTLISKNIISQGVKKMIVMSGISECEKKVTLVRRSIAVRYMIAHIQAKKSLKIQSKIKRKTIDFLNKRCIEWGSHCQAQTIVAVNHHQSQILCKAFNTLSQLPSKTKQIRLILSKLKLRKRNCLISQGLRSLQKANNKRKLRNILSKITFFCSLERNQRENKKTEVLAEVQVKNRAKQVLNHMRSFKDKTKQMRRIVAQSSKLKGRLLLMRLYERAVRNLIGRKQSLMVCKYRAQKVCRAVFASWKSRGRDHCQRGHLPCSI